VDGYIRVVAPSWLWNQHTDNHSKLQKHHHLVVGKAERHVCLHPTQ
jgi:hypothetical protein